MTNKENLSSLISWLESKPADETYLYRNFHNCLAAQYYKEVLKRHYTVSIFDQENIPKKSWPFKELLEYISWESCNWKSEQSGKFGPYHHSITVGDLSNGKGNFSNALTVTRNIQKEFETNG